MAECFNPKKTGERRAGNHSSVRSLPEIFEWLKFLTFKFHEFFGTNLALGVMKLFFGNNCSKKRIKICDPNSFNIPLNV
jgi:hypothetical protein